MRVMIIKTNNILDDSFLYKNYDLKIFLGPHSQNLLFKRSLFRDPDKICESTCLVIPSSYDDTAVYKIMRREYKLDICWSKYLLNNEIEIINSLSREYEKHLSTQSLLRRIIFIEGLIRYAEKPSRIQINKDILDNIIVYHGVSSSSGIAIDDALKIQISFEHSGVIVIDYDNKQIYAEFYSGDEKLITSYFRFL